MTKMMIFNGGVGSFQGVSKRWMRKTILNEILVILKEILVIFVDFLRFFRISMRLVIVYGICRGICLCSVVASSRN